MIELTHQQARALLQAAADQPLPAADRSALDAHLSVCNDCNAYAAQLAGVEARLRKALHTKWDSFRPDLNLQAIKQPSPASRAWNYFFSQPQVLGKVTIMAALLLGYIAIVNLVGIRVPITENKTPTVLPTPNGFTTSFSGSPTLSAQSARTDTTTQTCDTVIYVVQENDTLESIAFQHGITKETLLGYNPSIGELAANTVITGMELAIPLCESTPSRTASLPGSALTITPMKGTLLPYLAE